MKYTTHIFILIILLAPLVLFAEPPKYQPLVGLPGTSGEGPLDANSDFNTYINALYALSIGIAALLAVIKIIIAGVKYMLTDMVTTKGDAKKDIQGALLGLIIVLSAVLILTVINPQLVNVDLTMNQLEQQEYFDQRDPDTGCYPGQRLVTCLGETKCGPKDRPLAIICNPSLISSCPPGPASCTCDGYDCAVVEYSCEQSGGTWELHRAETRGTCVLR